MTSSKMRLSLRAGERIYLNGAVIRVDRKVTLELLNDVVFLLEAHVLQPEDTTTPLRQLYFVLQALLMDPGNTASIAALFADVYGSTLASFTNESVTTGLKLAKGQVEAKRVFDALRTIRGLFEIEAAIIGGPAARTVVAA